MFFLIFSVIHPLLNRHPALIIEAEKEEGMAMKTAGIIFTILSALLFAISPVLVSWTYGWGNNPLTMVLFRNLFVLPVLFVLMKRDHIAVRLPRDQFFQLLFVAAMGSCLTPLLLYSSYTYVGVGTGTTLHFFYPIFVALFCRFFYLSLIHI